MDEHPHALVVHEAADCSVRRPITSDAAFSVLPDRAATRVVFTFQDQDSSNAVSRLREPQGVLSIKNAGPRTPQLPEYGWTGAARIVSSTVLHVLAASMLVLVVRPGAVRGVQSSPPTLPLPRPTDVRQVVFIVRDPAADRGSGGGGGGDRQTGPIRRAHGIGSDAITLRAVKPARPAQVVAGVTAPPPVLLDAKPLVSGLFDQIGLPDSGVEVGPSTGPGSDGGAGTGPGTGIGPGKGPGMGPGSDGGIGDEVYQPGGAVTRPRVVVEVKPTYSSNALRLRIQGTVVLEFVVTRQGLPSQIRVIRSLDRELDQRAIDAASRWRFDPGRLAGDPVNVLVTLSLDFWIR